MDLLLESEGSIVELTTIPWVLQPSDPGNGCDENSENEQSGLSS